MFNFQKIPAILKIYTVCLLFLVSLAHAEERQLVNTNTLSLREGPGPQYKILKTLQNDQSFEVLETLNDFVRIRTTDGAEGWLPERSADTPPPEVITAKGSSEKTVALPTKHSEKTPSNPGRLPPQQPDTPMDSQPRKESSEQSSPRESTEIKKLQAELGEIKKHFNQLETASEEAQQLKAENDRLKSEISALQNTMAKLQQTNISLTENKNIYWFFAGSAVFLLGWLIGKISFRRQRHSSLTL